MKKKIEKLTPLQLSVFTKTVEEVADPSVTYLERKVISAYEIATRADIKNYPYWSADTRYDPSRQKLGHLCCYEAKGQQKKIVMAQIKELDDGVYYILDGNSRREAMLHGKFLPVNKTFDVEVYLFDTMSTMEEEFKKFDSPDAGDRAKDLRGYAMAMADNYSLEHPFFSGDATLIKNLLTGVKKTGLDERYRFLIDYEKEIQWIVGQESLSVKAFKLKKDFLLGPCKEVILSTLKEEFETATVIWSGIFSDFNKLNRIRELYDEYLGSTPWPERVKRIKGFYELQKG